VDEHCPVLDLFKNPVPVCGAHVTSGLPDRWPYVADPAEDPAGR